MPDDQPPPGAAEDGAFFAPVRVTGARRPRILASLVVVAVAALVAFGAFEKGPAPPQTATVADATPAPAASVPAPTTRSSRPRAQASGQPPGTVDGLGTGTRYIELAVRPAGSDLFIHGDVFSLEVARVTVRLEDPAGNAAATKSVDIPGGSTAFRIGAVPRFDVQFPLADEVQADGFMVSATALDSAGRRLTTLLQRFPRSVEASESGPITVVATRRPSMVTVIGAVSLQQVTRILVTVQSLDGQPAASASEVIPLSASDGKDHVPPLGFNIWLAVPAGLADQVLVVQTSAYDTRGLLLATTLAQLDPEP